MADAGDSSSAAARSAHVESEMGTMFILDLMRQKREKLMRLKKDEMINEMARKQREKMQKARDGYSVCDGTGFRGVQQIIDSADKTRGQPWRRKRDDQGQGDKKGS